jgi:hypothetical protein
MGGDMRFVVLFKDGLYSVDKIAERQAELQGFADGVLVPE